MPPVSPGGRCGCYAAAGLGWVTAVPANLDPPPPHERRRWRLDAAPPTDGWVEFYVHRRDCAQAQCTDRLLTGQEALGRLADPDATLPCPVCRPDRVLTVAS
ncbi:hypothetical protein GCM10012285_28180 [Streptomyces kronopolitis]|uniref:Uncharacterized protein n=1 Tax=Streptomyces kronopolitis TaxID=1612435 RepID=A0ABQ2JDS3_9ACTN|nr:hypothetical protein GCM10012285_28180 [Streptomyces kronopolitis]